MADELTAAMVAPLEGPVPFDSGGWQRRTTRRRSRRSPDWPCAAPVPGRSGSRTTTYASPSGLVRWRPTTNRSRGRRARRDVLSGWRRCGRSWRGETRTPHEAVRARLADSDRGVREGSRTVSQLDRWVASLSDAGRSAVAAEAVTWATRLWCALDWAALGRAPVIGTRPLVGQPTLSALGAPGPGRGAHPAGASGGAVGTTARVGAGRAGAGRARGGAQGPRRCGTGAEPGGRLVARLRPRRAPGAAPQRADAGGRTRWRSCWRAALPPASPRPEPGADGSPAPAVGGAGGVLYRWLLPWADARTSGTWRSWPTSTTARPPWWTRCCARPGPSARIRS